jgi:phosphoglycolate phosphatase
LHAKQLLFDLDGTLTDPRDGIVRCIQHALAELGVAVPHDTALERYIGPPIRDTFRELLPGHEASVERAVELYRARFLALGMYENRVYPGIPELLRSLCDAGLALHLCTSKPHLFARRILEHFALDAFFTSIHGSELDGTRNEKGELLAYILEREALVPADCAMIGDRRFDIEAASHNGVVGIGVLWGYGSRAELELAGAPHVVASPDALERLILGAADVSRR